MILLVSGLIGTACTATTSSEEESELTDEQLASLKQELAEKGFYNATSIADAEAIAGFKIAIPGYMPDGFNRQDTIILTQLGGGLPEEMKPKFTAIIVKTFYFLQGDETVMFELMQTQHYIEMGGSTLAEVCGCQGEKKYLEADPQRKYPSPVLTLAFEKDGDYYSIYATLAGPLDEVTIERILCSVDQD